MTTTQRPRPTVPAARVPTSSPWLIVGLVVIGLLAGLLGGWLLFDGDVDVITVDGTELTDRQIEMTEMLDDAMVAWRARDVDEVLSYYTDSAVFVAYDVEHPADTGSLGRYVTAFTEAPTMDFVGPRVVLDENTVVSFHTIGDDSLMDVFDFTPSGDVLIARHEVGS